MRRLDRYVDKYGPEFGPKLYHALQSQAAYASVGARLRRKIALLSGKTPAPPRKPEVENRPLFPEFLEAAETPEQAGVVATGG